MLTEDEVKALSAILDKAFEEAEDGDPEYQEVNIKDVKASPVHADSGLEVHRGPDVALVGDRVSNLVDAGFLG